MQVCKPYPEHCDRFSEVVRELRERDTQTKQAAREVTKRSLESGARIDGLPEKVRTKVSPRCIV